MVDKDVQELEDAKKVLAILSRLPADARVRDHEAAILAMLRRLAYALERIL